MANPRVFISSTCYDLSEVRDSLVDFIRSYGFEPVLSERGDVFYHPDVHTHDSCLNEVGNCELMVLIIGGRFGGTYIADPEKSIVNAEYAAAREHKIPVFTFVKRNVHSDHFVYSKNKANVSLNQIIFPSIDNNEHAEKIFEFIDDVRHAPVNNGFFPFDFAREIIDLLRKQWAGMFFEFLQQRSADDRFKTTTNLLDSISVAGDKVEELVKRLYRHIDAAGADATIKEVEIRSVAKKFFEECLPILEYWESREFDASLDPRDFDLWYDYLAKATGGTVNVLSGGQVGIAWENKGKLVRAPGNDVVEDRYARQQERFVMVKSMTPEALRSVMSELRDTDD